MSISDKPSRLFNISLSMSNISAPEIPNSVSDSRLEELLAVAKDIQEFSSFPDRSNTLIWLQ